MGTHICKTAGVVWNLKLGISDSMPAGAKLLAFGLRLALEGIGRQLGDFRCRI